MPKIPKYQQGQLASELVGTPGVDTSATSAFNSLASDARQVGTSVYGALEDEYVLNRRALQQQQTEQRAAAKHYQTLYNQGIATAASAAADTALDDLNGQLQQKYQNDVTGLRAEWDEKAREIIDSKLEGMDDPEQKLMAQNQLHEKLNAQTKSLTSWQNGRMMQISKDNANKLGDALRLSVNNAGLSGTQVLEKLDRFGSDPNSQVTFVSAHGNDAPVQMRKAQAEAAKDFLAQVANTGDEKRLDTLIHDKRFDKFITGQDKEQFYTRQRSLAAAVRTQQKLNMDIQETEDRSNIATVVLKTDPDDISSLQGSAKTLQGMLSDELRKPPELRSKEKISKLETEIGQVEKNIRDYPKKLKQEARQAAQEKRDQAYETYRSDAAAKVRLQLAGERAQLQERLKTTKNQGEALKLINTYAAKIERYGNGGSRYLDVPGSTSNEESERAFINKSIQGLKKTGSGGVLNQLRDGLIHFTGEAVKYFQGTTPAPGKTSLQTHDQMTSAYNAEMKSLTDRYRARHHGAPDQATLKKMHDYAMNKAFKDVHSAR